MRGCRRDSESDTADTDDDCTWHGLGKMEYSQKVLPHALLHTPEQYIRGGHLQAFCTFAVEQGHKRFIKYAGTASRVYASVNVTQDGMLKCVNERILFDDVVSLVPHQDTTNLAGHEGDPVIKLKFPLHYSQGWSALSQTRTSRMPVAWETQFLSAKVRITRLEFMRILCSKFDIEDSYSTHWELMRHCQFDFWGSVSITSTDNTRKFVAIHNDRRDFVRLRGTHDGTCLSAQLIVFVRITGLQDILAVPAHLENTSTDDSSITLALIRWLSPHPDAILRDQKMRPVCVPPFDINHALWTFSKTLRPELTDDIVISQESSYPDAETVLSERDARYDLVLPESLNQHINCTVVDRLNIMETITLPFQ